MIFMTIEDFTWTATHVYREGNQAADSLSKMALKYIIWGATNIHNQPFKSLLWIDSGKIHALRQVRHVCK